MSDQKIVSYKIYLYKEECATPKGPALEVRRIGIDRDVSTSVEYIKEKLISIFPVLGRTKTRYFLMWKDEENEWITIRTDNDLVIALTEMSGPVYRLYIQFTADNETGGNHASSFDLLGDPVAKSKLRFCFE